MSKQQVESQQIVVILDEEGQNMIRPLDLVLPLLTYKVQLLLVALVCFVTLWGGAQSSSKATRGAVTGQLQGALQISSKLNPYRPFVSAISPFEKYWAKYSQLQGELINMGKGILAQDLRIDSPELLQKVARHWELEVQDPSQLKQLVQKRRLIALTLNNKGFTLDLKGKSPEHLQQAQRDWKDSTAQAYHRQLEADLLQQIELLQEDLKMSVQYLQQRIRHLPLASRSLIQAPYKKVVRSAQDYSAEFLLYIVGDLAPDLKKIFGGDYQPKDFRTSKKEFFEDFQRLQSRLLQIPGEKMQRSSRGDLPETTKMLVNRGLLQYLNDLELLRQYQAALGVMREGALHSLILTSKAPKATRMNWKNRMIFHLVFGLVVGIVSVYFRVLIQQFTSQDLADIKRALKSRKL